MLRRPKLEPESWWVFRAPEEAPPHKHLVGIPCVDCKHPIWSGDRCFTIRGSGSVTDKRGRRLSRERTFLVCEECTNLRYRYHKARNAWPGINDPWERGVIAWASGEVELALEQTEADDA